MGWNPFRRGRHRAKGRATPESDKARRIGEAVQGRGMMDPKVKPEDVILPSTRTGRGERGRTSWVRGASQGAAEGRRHGRRNRQRGDDTPR